MATIHGVAKVYRARVALIAVVGLPDARAGRAAVVDGAYRVIVAWAKVRLVEAARHTITAVEGALATIIAGVWLSSADAIAANILNRA